MTNIIVSCTTNTEGKGIDFNVRLGQDENATEEEKMAALFLLPFVKEAFQKAMDAADQQQKKMDEENKSTIIKP